MHTAITYQARMLENPNDPVNSAWVALTDDNSADDDDYEGVTASSYVECYRSAVETLLVNNDVPDGTDPKLHEGFMGDMAELFIAQVAITYYIPGVEFPSNISENDRAECIRIARLEGN